MALYPRPSGHQAQAAPDMVATIRAMGKSIPSFPDKDNLFQRHGPGVVRQLGQGVPVDYRHLFFSFSFRDSGGFVQHRPAVFRYLHYVGVGVPDQAGGTVAPGSTRASMEIRLVISLIWTAIFLPSPCFRCLHVLIRDPRPGTKAFVRVCRQGSQGRRIGVPHMAGAGDAAGKGVFCRCRCSGTAPPSPAFPADDAGGGNRQGNGSRFRHPQGRFHILTDQLGQSMHGCDLLRFIGKDPPKRRVLSLGRCQLAADR